MISSPGKMSPLHFNMQIRYAISNKTALCFIISRLVLSYLLCRSWCGLKRKSHLMLDEKWKKICENGTVHALQIGTQLLYISSGTIK